MPDPALRTPPDIPWIWLGLADIVEWSAASKMTIDEGRKTLLAALNKQLRNAKDHGLALTIRDPSGTEVTYYAHVSNDDGLIQTLQPPKIIQFPRNLN